MGRIVVIDDDDLIRGGLIAVLEHHQHDVVGAADGLEGMAMVREREPDIVITDIFMPNQDGLRTIMDIRRDCPSVKIIAMSGAAFEAPDYLIHAKALGAIEVLKKPFHPRDLLRAIDSHLGRGAHPA